MRRATVVLTLILSTEAHAQTSDSISTARDWVIGVSAGIPGYEREPVPMLFTVGLNVSQTKPGRLGADFSIGTMPTAIVLGAAVLGARGGVVFPIAPSPAVTLLPSAGVSLVGGAAEGGGGAIAGLNAGVATIFWTGDVGIRTGVTWHRFQDFRESVWLVEFGVVHTKRL
jgi:hypothetical protein